jgi:Leucine-rich repeat (LRR) protein
MEICKIGPKICCRELKLSGNRLQEFPSEVVSLPRLKLLDLSLNELKTVQSTQAGFEHFQVAKYIFVKIYNAFNSLARY